MSKTYSLSGLDLSCVTQAWGKANANRSYQGQALSIGGQHFDHGMGTHAHSLLIVNLFGQADKFTAWVGIDDDAWGAGSGRFFVRDQASRQILVDSGPVFGGQRAVWLEADLRGCSVIELVMEDGPTGNWGSHGDWAQAQFHCRDRSPVAVPALQKVAVSKLFPRINLAGPGQAPAIHGPERVGFRTGTPLIWSVPVSGSRPRRWLVEGLPEGIHFDHQTGIFSGTLAQNGEHKIKIHCSNMHGEASKEISLVAGNTLALSPPMGWNSFDCFGGSVDETETLAHAALVKERLAPFGFDTVVVDYRWYDPCQAAAHAQPEGSPLHLDECGRCIPDPARFPSSRDGQGFKVLADRIHALGLKFGIHIMRGIPRQAVEQDTLLAGGKYRASQAADTTSTCGWLNHMYGVRADTDAGRSYLASLVELYAAWGVDYIKMDDASQPYYEAEVSVFRNLLDTCGRSIVFSLSPGAAPLDKADSLKNHANLWRISGDFWDKWDALDHQFELLADWNRHAGPGHWPDGDMLALGTVSIGQRCCGPERQTLFSPWEQLIHVSLWSLYRSPMMMGGNLLAANDWTWALLTNPEVLEPLFDNAFPLVSELESTADGIRILGRRMKDGSFVLGLFNRGPEDKEIRLNWSDWGMRKPLKLRDSWMREDLNFVIDTLTLPAHGCRLLRCTGHE